MVQGFRGLRGGSTGLEEFNDHGCRTQWPTFNLVNFGEVERARSLFSVGLVLGSESRVTTWEFPKIGDPNLVP